MAQRPEQLAAFCPEPPRRAQTYMHTRTWTHARMCEGISCLSSGIWLCALPRGVLRFTSRNSSRNQIISLG